LHSHDNQYLTPFCGLSVALTETTPFYNSLAKSKSNKGTNLARVIWHRQHYWGQWQNVLSPQLKKLIGWDTDPDSGSCQKDTIFTFFPPNGAVMGVWGMVALFVWSFLQSTLLNFRVAVTDITICSTVFCLTYHM
jgi:hypothetical protein